MLRKISKREGRKAQALLDEPKLTMHEQYYLDAFNTLSLSRSTDFNGVGTIPLSEIKAYCDLLGITSLDEKQDLLYIVISCDDFYLNEIKKRVTKNGTGSRKQPKTGNRQSAHGRRG